MEVYRWCDGSYLEDQDFWRLAELKRSLSLCHAKISIEDFTVTADLSKDYEDAYLI